MCTTTFRDRADKAARTMAIRHGAIEDAVEQSARRIRYFFSDGTAVDVTALPGGELRRTKVKA